MDVAAGANDLVKVVALLGAAVVMVPLFRHLGLGSVLGYLAAGLAIGPFGLGWFAHPEQVLHVAELGVVMFLFVIGLEMKPAHLWSLRQQIFGLGTAQIATCTVLLTGVGIAFGFPPATAFIAGMGFVMTSTAIVMQQLAERGDIALPNGQKIVSILLFEDLLIVPLLLLVAFMAPGAAPDAGLELKPVLVALASLAGVVVAGIWLLNPLFRVLAAARAREVMTAAALLVVLGAALLMQVGGLSMAMGAFLAGVLLSGSTFRHQIEADIEPFRGILLGLFFLGVGMALDLSVVGKNAALVILGVLVLMLAKASAIYVVARLMRSRHAEALDRAVLMAQGGEFAFVLFAAAAQAHVIDGQARASMTAIVVLSMVLTPVLVLLARRFSPSLRPSLDGIDVAQGLSGSVLIVGFGRFGQVASQSLLARGVDVTIIDRDVDMIRNATRFGFKVYYGDGTRLDVLHACGAASARAIAVCVNDRAAASRIAELAKQHFPQARLLVRSYDREHSLELAAQGIDLHVRETFESAMRFGEMALRALDVPAVEAAAIAEEVRRRDAERFQIERVGGYGAGRDLLHVNAPRPTPTPLTAPRRGAQALNKDAEEAALPAAAVPVAEAALPAAAPTVAEAALPAVAPTVAAAAIPSPPPPAVPAAASSADPAADEPVAAPGEPPRGS